MDSVPRLGNDKLRVNGRLVTVGNGKGSSAVPVHRVGATAKSPTRRNVAVNSNRVKLCQISVAVEGGLCEAIHQQLRSSTRKENCSVDCKGVRALDGRIRAAGADRHC